MKYILHVAKTLIVIGLLVHFTIKDSFYWSSLIFYALPLPVIIGLILFLILFLGKKLREISFVILILLTGIWLLKSYKTNDVQVLKEELEIVYWNAGHKNSINEAIDIIGQIPDVLVLIECDKQKFNRAKLKYSNNYFYFSDEGIGVFSKKPIIIVSENTSKKNTTILKFKIEELSFYAIDISPSIFNFRKKDLEFIDAHIKNPQKTIVLGDFNTPIESIHFEKFKTKFFHAFSEKGNGFIETWFWNLPILSLDHVWISKDLKFLSVEKKNTFKSDHCLIKIELEAS